MDFLATGIPIGTYFGIPVRLHFTFVIFALWRIQAYGDVAGGYLLGAAIIAGLYVCILLHEFGHALAARWCDGEAQEILLWPLGGLAYVRPAFHPTAHLITTVAGPFVTFVLWLVFWGFLWVYQYVLPESFVLPRFLLELVSALAIWNFVMLIFNLIPAFPMDGGRILRDFLWYWTNAETATRVAIFVSRAIALFWAAGTILAMLDLWDPKQLTGVFAWLGMVIRKDSFWPLLMAAFVFISSRSEAVVVDFEGRGTYTKFSIRDRIKRGSRQRAFRQGVKARVREEAVIAFHTCGTCGRTEKDSPLLTFRVCTDCANYEEYCEEHLNNHQHK